MLFWPASTDGNIFFLLLAQLYSIFSPYFDISVLLAAYAENFNLLWPYFQPYHCTTIRLSQVSNWLSDSKAISSSLCSWTSLEHLIHLTRLFFEPLEFKHLQIHLAHQTDLLQISYKGSFIMSLLCSISWIFPHLFVENKSS